MKFEYRTGASSPVGGTSLNWAAPISFWSLTRRMMAQSGRRAPCPFRPLGAQCQWRQVRRAPASAGAQAFGSESREIVRPRRRPCSFLRDAVLQLVADHALRPTDPRRVLTRRVAEGAARAESASDPGRAPCRSRRFRFWQREGFQNAGSVGRAGGALAIALV